MNIIERISFYFYMKKAKKELKKRTLDELEKMFTNLTGFEGIIEGTKRKND